MKLGEQNLKPNLVVIPIPRGDADNVLIFRARAVESMAEFDRLCPKPMPGVKKLPGGVRKEDTNSPAYKAAMQQYGACRLAWMVLDSLAATEDLTWDTVVADQPETWCNYQKELREAGFNDYEVARIVQGVLEANCLSDDLVDEARKRFLSQEREALLQSQLDQDVVPTT